MVNMLQRKIRMNDGFDVSEVVTPTQDKKENEEHGKLSKKLEDVKLQTLLDKDDSQIQEQLAEQLRVSQQSVSNRPRKMGKIQKTDRWELYESNK